MPDMLPERHGFIFMDNSIMPRNTITPTRMSIAHEIGGAIHPVAITEVS